VSPATPGGVVVVEERYGTEPWRRVAIADQDAAGRVSVQLGRRTKVGSYGFRVVRAAEGNLVSGVGEGQTVVTVTGVGKASAWTALGGTKRRPEHWGTCSIGYQVNRGGAPTFGLADLREAMRRVTMVSGIRFHYLGATTIRPTASQPVPEGLDRLVVAWSTPRQSQRLVYGEVSGHASLRHDPGNRFHSASLTINRTWLAHRSVRGFGKGQSHGVVLMHELGHVVGLEHVRATGQVMQPVQDLPAAVWGAGDLTGLRRVGAASGCR
jgi:hypothetical protein